MLPERLSNGICSLNPKVERLTFTCEMEIDPKGRFIGHKIYKSVIRTRERMTYTQVNAILTARTPEHEQRYGYLLADFERMHVLFEILRRGASSGSIDFDLPRRKSPEAGTSKRSADRAQLAHRLIEEFMLRNETVARETVLANQPASRHHPPTLKLEDQRDPQEFKLKLRGNVKRSARRAAA
jgi:ribonuclease R